MKLKVLWERGRSNLYTIDHVNQVIVFFCWETITSIKVGGFDVSGENTIKSEASQGYSEHTAEWTVTVPFGCLCNLEWFQQWDVTVLCTAIAPLEITSEWFGGGDSCYYGYGILPNGEEIIIEGNEELPLGVEYIQSQWVNKIVSCKDTFVEVEIR